MYETDLLTHLQNARYTEGDNMREHLTTMTEIKERLAEMNFSISDESFVTYIRTSLSLAPTFRPLFIALSAAARKSGKPLTSSELIWHLTEEAASTSIEDSINKSNAAMVAHQKGKGRGKGGSSKSKSDRYCTNCEKEGHTKDQCWQEGGGKAGEAPSWWKPHEKKGKDKKKGSSGANAAEKPDSDSENYAFLVANPIDDEDQENVALAVTSDFQSEAHAASQSSGIIIDCGATNHFSPNASEFKNFHATSPEPIRAADGRTFSAILSC